MGGQVLAYPITVFTALRPERLPLEDAEVEAEIERLKALPLAEYEAQRESAASRLGMRLSVLDRFRSDGAKGGTLPILATLSKTKMKKVAREECERLLKQRYKKYVDNPDPDKERPLKDEVRSEMLEIKNSTGPRQPRSGRTVRIPAYDPRSGDFERPPHCGSINQRRPVLHDMSTMLPQAQSLSPSAQMPRSDDPSRRGDVGLQSLRLDRRRTIP
jgi:hypothetical protein